MVSIIICPKSCHQSQISKVTPTLQTRRHARIHSWCCCSSSGCSSPTHTWSHASIIAWRASPLPWCVPSWACMVCIEACRGIWSRGRTSTGFTLVCIDIVSTRAQNRTAIHNVTVDFRQHDGEDSNDWLAISQSQLHGPKRLTSSSTDNTKFGLKSRRDLVPLFLPRFPRIWM